MENLYYNFVNIGSYRGVKRLAKSSENTTSETQKWLSVERAYTLHKPFRKRMPEYRTYKFRFHGYQFQADLNKMVPLASENHGYKYILTCIDLFSRYGWAIALNSQKVIDVTEAYNTIQDKAIYLQTDLGKEFYNETFKKYLGEVNTKLFSVHSPHKCALVERFNRTIKTRMYRYFTFKNTRKWIDILPSIIKSYNNTPHTSLPKGLTPHQLRNRKCIQMSICSKDENLVDKVIFIVGDSVRLSKLKGIFEKGYVSNWTEQIFYIHSIDAKVKPIMYIVRDYKNEIIEGKFYGQELQKVIKPDKWPVEKIIKKHKDGRVLLSSVINNINCKTA